MKIKSIHLLGLANGLKPKYILEILSSMNLLSDKEVVFLTDEDSGIAVDFCKKKKIEYKVTRLGEQSCLLERADLLIAIGWNKLLSKKVLAHYGTCINCHGGLLPDYRGNNTYMHSYANLENYYGVTIHFMNEMFDDGDILMQGKLKLFVEETPQIMHRRIAELTAYLIPTAIHLVESEYKGIRQEGKARYFYKISREEMEKLRQRNIENLRMGRPKEFARFREWNINI